MKRCSKCKAEKPLDEFNKHRKMKDGRQPHCKACKREWRLENLEKIREYYHQWYLENREAVLEYQHKYRLENPEKVRAGLIEWRRKNPHNSGLHVAIRRSPLSEHDLLEGASREEVLAETKFIYILCRLISEQTGIPHEIDHIHMIKDGGVHRLHNLRIITRSENRSRGDHSADGFDLEDDLTDEEIERLDQEVLDAAYA